MLELVDRRSYACERAHVADTPSTQTNKRSGKVNKQTSKQATNGQGQSEEGKRANERQRARASGPVPPWPLGPTAAVHSQCDDMAGAEQQRPDGTEPELEEKDGRGGGQEEAACPIVLADYVLAQHRGVP
jgi:hypothetical protein